MYIGKQYNYNDQIPTQRYKDFTKAVGCNKGANTTGADVFQCLVNTDTAVLQNASGTVSESGAFGTFAFLPVTDGSFIQSTPSQQIFNGTLSGKRLLIGVCNKSTCFPS